MTGDHSVSSVPTSPGGGLPMTGLQPSPSVSTSCEPGGGGGGPKSSPRSLVPGGGGGGPKSSPSRRHGSSPVPSVGPASPWCDGPWTTSPAWPSACCGGGGG